MLWNPKLLLPSIECFQSAFTMCSSVTRYQNCFFTIRPFSTIKISPKAHKVCQSKFRICWMVNKPEKMPNYFKILPHLATPFVWRYSDATSCGEIRINFPPSQNVTNEGNPFCVILSQFSISLSSKLDKFWWKVFVLCSCQRLRRKRRRRHLLMSAKRINL